MDKGKHLNDIKHESLAVKDNTSYRKNRNMLKNMYLLSVLKWKTVNGFKSNMWNIYSQQWLIV